MSQHRDGIQAGRSGFDCGGGKIFLLFMAFEPALGPTQPRIQWVLGAFFPG
jgi:hypothetical protein